MTMPRNVSVPGRRGPATLPPPIAPGLLTERVFESLETSVAPVIESPALSHRVPNGRLYRLGSPFPAEGRQRIYRLLLTTRATFTAVASSAGGVLTLNIPAASRIVASPDLPGVASIQVATQPSATPGWVLQAAGALTVNYGTQVVTVSGLTASTNYDAEVYGLMGDPYGRVSIIVNRAGGGPRTAETELWQGTLSELHENSQVRGGQIPELAGATVALPADEVSVLVNSSVRHSPPVTLTPGDVLIGDRLERVEFRPNTAHVLALLAWAHMNGAPGVTAEAFLRVLRAAQAGDTPALLAKPWSDLPPLPELALSR